MKNSNHLLNDQQAIEKIFDHIDNNTTDLGDETWKEPVENYFSQERFNQEIQLLRRLPVPFCPSAALPEKGSYIARQASGTPLLTVRGSDGEVRSFINACRHRGMQVAQGIGCSNKAFVCPYHAWSYSLDGKLQNIPGEEAFPGINKNDNGLVQVEAIEKGGIVYVQQEGSIDKDFIENILDYFQPEQEMFDHSEVNDKTNWKLLTETLLEGYHIKSLHKKTFFPYGLDNINLVETFGPNSRVIFPFRRIEKLRELKPEDRKINGTVTKVYHLFPNASVSMLSKHSNLTVMEPIAPNEVKTITYSMVNLNSSGQRISNEDAQKDLKFVNEQGQSEDREAARAIFETVTAKGNSHLTFGYFEKAIVNFHQHLNKMLLVLLLISG
jgi:phenylpropionate dioxygenase-like ring-hydroxylating dioxygenase large terminal subunit